MNPADIPNLNLLWASLIVEELCRHGIRDFCIAPGSRSSPLTIAVARHPEARAHLHFDERGLAFLALGLSASGKTSALITTSGTAVANLLPAIIECSKKKLPLILLTADRPPELRETGAHQTIDQVGIFGNYCRWFVDLPCPDENIPPAYVLTTVDRAVSRSKGELRGPVHLNCMYREPLALQPDKADIPTYMASLHFWTLSRDAYTTYHLPDSSLDEDELRGVYEQYIRGKKGVILLGKIPAEAEEATLSLIDQLQWPVFPDFTSGFRLKEHPCIINYFDALLSTNTFAELIPRACVLHLGGRMTSKRIYQWIEHYAPEAYIHLLSHPLRSDPLHKVSIRLQSRLTPAIRALAQCCEPATKAEKAPWLSYANASKEIMDNYFEVDQALSEPQIARVLLANIPDQSALFMGNSLPVRLLDQFAPPNNKNLLIGGNRGASGIDGTLASALGFALGNGRKLTLLLGDLSMLHDLNSLAMAGKIKPAPVIVLINNEGGGIFHFLPVAGYREVFEPYFNTPHAWSFRQAAAMFRLRYEQPVHLSAFEESYLRALSNDEEPTLIELKTNKEETKDTFTNIQKELRMKLAGTAGG